MTAKYEPEIGQALFGQPSKEFEVPPIWEAALAFLSEELSRVMGNIHGRDWASPFENTGDRITFKTFKVEAYSWSDDEQPYNFKWRNVEISWYKYFGRGMSSNQELSPNRAAVMLDECLATVHAYEKSCGPTSDR